MVNNFWFASKNQKCLPDISAGHSEAQCNLKRPIGLLNDYTNTTDTKVKLHITTKLLNDGVWRTFPPPKEDVSFAGRCKPALQPVAVSFIIRPELYVLGTEWLSLKATTTSFLH